MNKDDFSSETMKDVKKTRLRLKIYGYSGSNKAG